MGRAVDIPLDELPEIDEHAVEIKASADEVFAALITTIRRWLTRPQVKRIARALACEQVDVAGEPDRIGSTYPGFLVVRVVKPAVLALEGDHRFSDYGLIFRLDEHRDGTTTLRAETRGAFPGLKGRVYRALVIGTRGHVLAVWSVLRAVRRRAEREASPSTSDS